MTTLATYDTNPAAAQRRALMEQALGFFWPAAGIGAGLAGVKALRGLVTDTLRQPPRLPIRRTVVRLPVPSQAKPDDDEEGATLKAAAEAFAKLAEGPPAAPRQSFSQAIAGALTGATGGGPTPTFGKSWFWPEGSTSWHHAPATYPVAMLAALGGGHLAYNLADKAFSGVRGVGRKQEVEEARQDFQDALLGKSAAAEAIDGFRKQGLYGEVVGGALALAAAAAYASGRSAYGYADRNSPESAIRKAIRQREEDLFEARPAPIVVVPEAMRPRKPKPTIEDYRRRMAERMRGMQGNWSGPKALEHAPDEKAAAADLAGAVQRERASLDARRAAWQQVIAQMNGQKPGAKAPAKATPAGPPSLGNAPTAQ